MWRSWPAGVRPEVVRLMSVAALGSVGWFDPDARCLIGSRCESWGVVSFPPELRWCRNPACDSTSITRTSLGGSGSLWSFTTAEYRPPPPFVAGDPYEPFVLAAVRLDESGIVVIGRAAGRSGVDGLRVGQRARLDVGVLFCADGVDQLMWEWRIDDV